MKNTLLLKYAARALDVRGGLAAQKPAMPEIGLVFFREQKRL